MAKNITLTNSDGSTIYYPKTVAEEVYHNSTGQTVAAEISAINADLTAIGPELSQVKNVVDLLEVDTQEGEAVTTSLVSKLLIDVSTNKLKTSSYNYRKVAYYENGNNAVKLHVVIERVEHQSSTGVCGYVDSEEDVVAGTSVQNVDSSHTATSGTSDFYYDLPANKVFVIDITTTGDTLTIKPMITSLVIDEQIEEMSSDIDELEAFKESVPIETIDKDSVIITNIDQLVIDGSTSKIATSSYNARKVAYYKTTSAVKLHIVNNRTASSSADRGYCGYVDSISDVAAGTTVQGLDSSHVAGSGISDFYYNLPANKVFVIDLYYAGGMDIVTVSPTSDEVITLPFNSNIIDGSYSWWSGPHCDRKILGRKDFSIIAYQKSTLGLCIALYNNNSHTYVEKTLMSSINVDDHNGPACLFLDDGRILVTTASGHAAGPNQYIFISDSPFSVDSFTETVFTTQGDCSYSRLIKQGDYIFLFWREAIDGDSHWHCIYTDDEFETNSGELEFVDNTYVAVERTTNQDYIKIIICGHPVEGSTENNKIRVGYIKLSTMDILDGDGATKIADVGTLVSNSDFTVIIDSASGSKNRFLDAAITDVGVDVFAYANGDNSSSPYNGKYHVYNNGTDTEICSTGEPFYPSSKYVGGIAICRMNNNKIVLSREEDGIWYLEKWDVTGGTREIIDFSDAYILRPVESAGCQFVYQKGDYDESSFGGFLTNLIVKDICY